MIYLFSDDSYFLLGVSASINETKKRINLVNVNIDGGLLLEPRFSPKDTLILAMECTENATSFLTSARICGARILLVIDYTSKETMIDIKAGARGMLTKKMKLDDLRRYLDTDYSCMREMPFLTGQEMKVMGCLMTGKTPYRVSKELNLSVKTVFTHKLNALNKLGLNHLNARSLLIYGSMYHGFIQH